MPRRFDIVKKDEHFYFFISNSKWRVDSEHTLSPSSYRAFICCSNLRKDNFDLFHSAEPSMQYFLSKTINFQSFVIESSFAVRIKKWKFSSFFTVSNRRGINFWFLFFKEFLDTQIRSSFNETKRISNVYFTILPHALVLDYFVYV